MTEETHWEKKKICRKKRNAQGREADLFLGMAYLEKASSGSSCFFPRMMDGYRSYREVSEPASKYTPQRTPLPKTVNMSSQATMKSELLMRVNGSAWPITSKQKEQNQRQTTLQILTTSI